MDFWNRNTRLVSEFFGLRWTHHFLAWLAGNVVLVSIRGLRSELLLVWIAATSTVSVATSSSNDKDTSNKGQDDSYSDKRPASEVFFEEWWSLKKYINETKYKIIYTSFPAVASSSRMSVVESSSALSSFSSSSVFSSFSSSVLSVSVSSSSLSASPLESVDSVVSVVSSSSREK